LLLQVRFLLVYFVKLSFHSLLFCFDSYVLSTYDFSLFLRYGFTRS
jgi:hypothetical protein